MSWLSGMAEKKSRRVRTFQDDERTGGGRGREDVLSFAVFALAVEDINERERVMTSATPFAFL
jgi:hypothetical protein